MGSPGTASEEPSTGEKQDTPEVHWAWAEVQGQETLEVSLSITALVKEDQAQKRRIECNPPWGL